MLKLIKFMIVLTRMMGVGEIAKAPPPAVYPVIFETSPIGIVTRLANNHGVPLINILIIWDIEASFKVNPEDGKDGERGAFQITKDAAALEGCPWDWDFEHSAECGIRYYKRGLRLCRDEVRASEFYNTGGCGGKKRRAYAVDFAQKLARFKQIQEDRMAEERGL